MACLYIRKNSPYWWLKPKTGKARSTKMRHAVPHETQKANDILEREKANENQRYAEPERWEFWVPQYIKERYEESPKSLDRYEFRWRSIRAFLSRHKIDYPRQLTFNVVTLYVAWRRAGDKQYGVWPSGKNTAIGDVKFLGLIMKRAIQLSYANGNPCQGLGLKKAKPKEKPEITPEHVQKIWSELQAQPEWMRTCFSICFFTGCRLHESAVPLSDVDIKNRFIHFPQAKGGKPFTVPLRDELIPLFTRLHDERRGKLAFDMPCATWNLASLAFWKFFQRIELPYSIHCTRVTFITNLARAGVPINDAMRLVNHASHEIHKVYQRFQPEDLRASLQKLSLPSLT
jgi:integrase